MQNAGDIIYLPAHWPHCVRHITDTLALQCNMLMTWDSERALQVLDFSGADVRTNSMYRAAIEWAIADADELNLPVRQVARMSVQLAEKVAVGRFECGI